MGGKTKVKRKKDKQKRHEKAKAVKAPQNVKAETTSPSFASETLDHALVEAEDLRVQLADARDALQRVADATNGSRWKEAKVAYAIATEALV